jgi:hypothetical protein
MPSENVIAVVKPSGQRYLFLFDNSPATRTKLRETFCEFALDPELDFSWLDCTICGNEAEKLQSIPSLPGRSRQFIR